MKNNLENYKYNNVEAYNNDSIKLLTTLRVKIDAIFVDPQQGGPNYKYDNNLQIKL